MKSTASHTSYQAIVNLAHRLHLARTQESAYGAGIMTADYKRKDRKAGWTTEQLLAMSAAKSFYN
ncbi:MAG: hypothetical protein WBA76_18855 [Phormidesmis sp.]